ncbi:MAG TPA: IclR family transcriptional regulator [Candidatus Binataceae bacterium]|nr:IclR family transcriptional regulator [Candidatus Binataceae bacterium]
MMRRDKTNYVIQSVAHSLDVLEQFSNEVDELGVTELSKRLKLHKNNVFRLLATLEARGYIEQNKATENYRLGIRCLNLGRWYIDHMGLVRQARPILAELSRRCRESAFIGIIRREGVVPLEAAEPEDRHVKITLPIGQCLPLYCTAAGKVYLAFAPEDELTTTIPAQLPSHTTRTLHDRQTLVEQLRAMAAEGYAVDRGEYLEDVCSVAVPIRDYTRSVVGSLAVAGPAYRLSEERIIAEIVPAIMDAGSDLSQRLGYKE